MIDIESEVFDTVATVVRAQYSGAFVTSSYLPAPAKFPCLILAEQDNSTYQRTIDNMTSENHAQVMFSAEVYSDKQPGKKAEAKAIMALVDTEMQKMGFLRLNKTPTEIPNGNSSLYRLVARYRAVVSKDYMVYHK